jgi:RHS repeat-associated protein
VNGTTTSYATTDINPTGYSQVVGESYSPRVNGTESQHSYIYGLDAALELRSHYDGVGNNLTQQMYFVHDGHGSVRAITDQNGAVTDTYDYDAFGVLIHQTGTTPNTTLYSGEQFDPDLNLYYNRARYLSVSTGRFWTMDTFEGRSEDPLSLHKYLYTGANPVNRIDPKGKDFIDSIGAVALSVTLFVSSTSQLLSEAFEEGGTAVGQIFNEFGQVAENYAGQVLTLVEDEIGEIEILRQQNIGGRVIDFVVRNAETAKQMFIEVKYAFPSSAEATSRLVAQIQAASQAAQQGGGQVVLWTLRSLTPSQLQSLESELQNSEVQILSGVEALGNAVLNYFK